MSEIVSKIPFERESYRKSWQSNQEDQVRKTNNFKSETYLISVLGRLR